MDNVRSDIVRQISGHSRQSLNGQDRTFVHVPKARISNNAS